LKTNESFIVTLYHKVKKIKNYLVRTPQSVSLAQLYWEVQHMQRVRNIVILNYCGVFHL
jgi:hypothetical protein